MYCCIAVCRIALLPYYVYCFWYPVLLLQISNILKVRMIERRIFRRKTVAQVHCFVAEPANQIPWTILFFLHILRNNIFKTSP